MRLSQNSELITILNTEADTAMNDHKVKVKHGGYNLKRDESAGLSYVRGIEHLTDMVNQSSETGAQLTRELMKERDSWRTLRDERRKRYEQGNAQIKDVLWIDGFYDGVQHVMSVVLEHTVQSRTDEDDQYVNNLGKRVEFLELITGIKYDIELYEKAEFIAKARFDEEREEIVTDYIKILKGEGGAAK